MPQPSSQTHQHAGTNKETGSLVDANATRVRLASLHNPSAIRQRELRDVDGSSGSRGLPALVSLAATAWEFERGVSGQCWAYCKHLLLFLVTFRCCSLCKIIKVGSE